MKKLKYSSITATLLAIGISAGTLGAIPATANYVESCYEQNCTVWFSHTGEIQTWHPPINARNMTFQVSGGQGGKSGGQGGRVTGTLTQIPSTLYIAVAGAGITGQAAAGGFNGGGAAGSGSNNEGSGGGSSDIRLGTSVESRIVVAGGGGGRGAGITPTASPGGGLVAAAGKDGQGQGGGGGSQTSGGYGGAANGLGTSGSAGSLLTGGKGGSSDLYGGGGGGGGYFGGGGGGSDTDSSGNDAGAGGGGSSFADPSYTSNITHFTGVKSGHGLVMIEYQLVPLFQSIGSEIQLTNSSSVDFQIELSDTFLNFSASHIEIVGDSGTCQPGTLSGSGTSLVYTVTDCIDGEVGISIPANSISVQGYTGPELTQSSALVAVDQTAPDILEITQEQSELTISMTEAVLQPQPEDYLLTSSNNTCQVGSITAGSDQLWQASLVGCEDSSFSFTILANSVSDLAGNTGPAQDTSFEVVVPVPVAAPSPEPTISSAPETVTAAEPTGPAAAPVTSSAPTTPNVLEVPPQESSPPEAVLETAPTEDAEIAQSPPQRRQAAQSVISASSDAEPVNSNVGWTVGLAIAGVLLLVAGLSLRRRGISDLLVG
jgi:hypothetical protein